MKKKVCITFLLFLLTFVALSATIFAAQKQYFPITAIDKAGDKTKINSFQVMSVEKIPGSNRNRIHYSMSANKITGRNAFLDVRCYDAAGNYISTVNLRDYYVVHTPFEVPDTTASIEIIGWDTRQGDSYVYKRDVTVYASDGRSMTITDLQVPAYEAVGWSRQRNTQTSGGATAAVTGEQKTYFPVLIVDKDGDKTQINSFQVTGVENVPGRYVNRIYYTLTASKITLANAFIDVKCYNAAGELISTIAFKNNYVSNNPIEVPDTTATIELVGAGSSAGDSYLYRKMIMVMSSDGRSMDITDLQLPIYRYVGWDIPVYMFSLEGRCIAVPASQVEVHRQVGWYTYDGYYGALCWYCDDLLAKGAYEGVFMSIENGLAFLAGTEYEASLYAYRTRAMDAWRTERNAPLIATVSGVKQNGVVAVQFRNVSYKDIRSFDATFGCYYYNGGYKGDFNAQAISNIYIPSAGLREYSWVNSYFGDITRIDNIRITRVEFTDGTVWTAG